MLRIRTGLAELLPRSQDHLRFMDSKAWSPRLYLLGCYSMSLLLFLLLVAEEVFSKGSLTMDQQMITGVIALVALPILGLIYFAPLAIIFRACRLLLTLLDPQRSKACLNPDIKAGEIIDSVSVWVGRQTFRVLGLPFLLLALSFGWFLDPLCSVVLGVLTPFSFFLAFAAIAYPAQSIALAGAMVFARKKLTLEFLWRAQATISPLLLAWYFHHNFDLPDPGLVFGCLFVAYLCSSRYLSKYCLTVLASDIKSN